MIVRFFKTQEPLNIVLLLIIAFALRLPYLLSSSTALPVLHYEEPFSIFIFENLGAVWASKTWNVIITTLIIFIQALWINKIVFDFSLLYKNSYLPGLLYVIITALFPSCLLLNGAIISVFFLLWIFVKLFKLYKSSNTMIIVFDVGMIIALASLFYFPSVYWIFLIFIALSIFRPFVWREWIAGIVGFMIPYLFIAFYYFWIDRPVAFLSIWSPLNNNIWNIPAPLNRNDFYPLIPVILILIIALNKLRENFYKNVVHVRKCQQLLIAAIFTSTLAYYTRPAFLINHFILLAAPLSVFISYYFLVAKRIWLSELLLLIMIGVIVYFQLAN